MNNLKFFFRLMSYWGRGKEPVFEIFLKRKIVLDLGCGPASIVLKDKDNFYGVDINENSINTLKSKGAKVSVSDVTKTNFGNSFFDTVHSSNVIEHLDPENARKMILEAKRILKVGGKIVIISPMPRTVWNTFGHVKPYPPSAIKKLLRKESYEAFDSVEGLEIENIFYYGSWGSNKITLLISTIYSNIFPTLAGSYLLILKKHA